MNINDYLRPDERWAIFGMPDGQSYLKTMMLSDEFLAEVPQDIKKSFITLQHMIAHAYFHYELYDEAYKKLLGLYEMAIKYSYISLISLPKTQQNQEIPNLHKMINHIARQKHLRSFKMRLHEVRQKRNIAAHPKDYGFSGIVLKSSMFGVLNMINIIFASRQSVEDWHESAQRLSKRFKPFRHGPYLLKLGEYQHLIDSFNMETMLSIDKAEIALCHCKVIGPDSTENLKHSIHENPVILLAEKLIFTGNRLTGIHKSSGEPFSIEKVTASLELKRWKAYQQELLACGGLKQQMNQAADASYLTNQVEAFIHRYGKSAFKSKSSSSVSQNPIS
ncbi:hypothetical protein [Pedobacter paludis]|uniref:Uncharacterized protein n=1 Tax=Pedobacter paludis TaxID=2203212 RepID=A0A317F485_9SPHI|nr:hypothetical protein [Pedobacter paludis]PWS33372.1 hypothetical protein DF947_01730 [Pedobacter paludis]